MPIDEDSEVGRAIRELIEDYPGEIFFIKYDGLRKDRKFTILFPHRIGDFDSLVSGLEFTRRYKRNET